MSIQLSALRVVDDGPIQIVVAGYRARPRSALIAAAGLGGSIYVAQWRCGDWSDAIDSLAASSRCFGQSQQPVLARAAGAGLKLVGGGVGQFHTRHQIAVADGRFLADALSRLPGAADRPIRLIGHSLGTVLIHSALPAIDRGRVSVDSVTLMGSAAPRIGWERLADTFTGPLVNLFSPCDYILKFAPLPHAVAGTGVIGDSGLAGRVVNVDLANRLPHPMAGWRHHCGYWRLMAGLVE